MRGAAAVVLGALLAACGPAPGPVRLRHETPRTFEWKLTQSEEAPHPLFGVGGEIESEATVSLSCIGVDPDGSGQYEVTVRGVRMSAPAESGLAVDTSAKGPVPGDRIGATPVALALLPRRAVVRVGTTGAVSGGGADAAVDGHLGAWAKAKPVASQGAILRLHQTLDPGPLAGSWFQTAATLLPPVPSPAAGATWVASPAAVETPAGRLRATLTVACERPDGRTAVLRGSGAFALEGESPSNFPLRFRGGVVEMTAALDLVTGSLLACEERGRLDLETREAGEPSVHWAWNRRLSAK